MFRLRKWRPTMETLYQLCLALMIVAIGINLFQFHHIDKRNWPNYKALHNFDSGNIFRIATANLSSRLRVSPFYYFGVISPNSTVILPSRRLQSWFELEPSLMGFGRARRILFRDYDPETEFSRADNAPYEVDLSRYVPKQKRIIGTKRITRTLKERFSVFRQSPDARTFVVLAPNGNPGRVNPILFVDVRLMDDAFREALGRDL